MKTNIKIGNSVAELDRDLARAIDKNTTEFTYILHGARIEFQIEKKGSKLRVGALHGKKWFALKSATDFLLSAIGAMMVTTAHWMEYFKEEIELYKSQGKTFDVAANEEELSKYSRAYTELLIESQRHFVS